MISDVLFEALEKIEEYQRELPDTYDDWRAEIEEAKVIMRQLQGHLDNPDYRPSDQPLRVNVP